MRTLALTVCALLIAGTAWAGSPDSWDITTSKNLVELTIVEADTLARMAIDTVVVDIGSWLDWFMTGDGTTITTNCMGANDGAAGDSITVAVDNGMEFGGPWKTSAIALADLNGQGAPKAAAVTFGRYFRFRIAANDSTSGAPYTLRLIFPRGDR